MSDVLQFSSYKEFLKSVIHDHRDQRGFQTRLAEAANCQPSYLSQSLHGKADLMPDQAIGIAEFLELNEIESDFFLNLVSLARATSKPLKTFLEKKMAHLQVSANRLEKKLGSSAPMSPEIEKFYYTSWYWTAIHIATSVSKLQTVKALAEWLSLPTKKIRYCLDELKHHGLVKQKGDQWIYHGGATHLPAESLMTELNHTHWRQRAILDVQREIESSLHYTSVVSMSAEDAKKMRDFLVQTISKSRKISDPSSPEDVFCFNLDFYKV